MRREAGRLLGPRGEAFESASRHAASFKAGRDDRDANLIAHIRIDDRAEDQVDIRMRGLANDGRGLVDFEESHVRAAGDIEEHAARTVNGDVEQLNSISLVRRRSWRGLRRCRDRLP